MSKYGVFPVLYFPVFRLNTEEMFSLNVGKYGPEKCPYLGFFPSVTGGESDPIVFIFLEWYRGKDI